LRLILASSSPIRRQLLAAAGVVFDVASPGVDEAALKYDRTDPVEIASELAAAKALALDRDAWTIGSDSVASVEGRLFDKPASRADAAEHLRHFSGRALRLTSAVVLARSGKVDWSHVASAMLHVRPLSDAFIHSYLDAEWPEVGYCVGVFRLEGRGVQLFSAIDGDHFTILGLPLLPLLGALRERGLLTS
jgi:septum formation protein